MANDAYSLINKLWPERKEEDFWQPCLEAFFQSKKLELPVYTIRLNEKTDRRIFLPRKGAGLVINTNEGELHRKLGYRKLLDKISGFYGRPSLRDDSRKLMADGSDSSGIELDLVQLTLPRLSILEVKPDCTWTHNQSPGQAYSHFVAWMIALGIKTEYLFLMPSDVLHKKTESFLTLQKQFGDAFGFVFFEDIFKEMADSQFAYPGVAVNWAEHTKKLDWEFQS